MIRVKKHKKKPENKNGKTKIHKEGDRLPLLTLRQIRIFGNAIFLIKRNIGNHF